MEQLPIVSNKKERIPYVDVFKRHNDIMVFAHVE